eukprot:scaffold7332_cov146-Amphora_coffeaeformis.AAC.1
MPIPFNSLVFHALNAALLGLHWSSVPKRDILVSVVGFLGLIVVLVQTTRSEKTKLDRTKQYSTLEALPVTPGNTNSGGGETGSITSTSVVTDAADCIGGYYLDAEITPTTNAPVSLHMPSKHLSCVFYSDWDLANYGSKRRHLRNSEDCSSHCNASMDLFQCIYCFRMVPLPEIDRDRAQEAVVLAKRLLMMRQYTISTTERSWVRSASLSLPLPPFPRDLVHNLNKRSNSGGNFSFL